MMKSFLPLFSVFIISWSAMASAQSIGDEPAPIAPQRYDELQAAPSYSFGPPGGNDVSKETLWGVKKKKEGNRAVAAVPSGEKLLRAKVGAKNRRYPSGSKRTKRTKRK